MISKHELKQLLNEKRILFVANTLIGFFLNLLQKKQIVWFEISVEKLLNCLVLLFFWGGLFN